MARVYVSRRVPGPVLEALRSSFDVNIHDSEMPLDRRALLDRASGADGCVLTLTDRADAEFFDAVGPQLRVLSNYAVGFDNVDLDAATDRGVIVSNTPDVLTHATAEFAIALMLNRARRVCEGDRMMRARAPWEWAPTMMLGTSLRGLTLGVVGFGRIGREVARLAAGLGMDVVFSDSIAHETEDFEQVPFGAVLERSDIVTLHCPLLPETRHLISRAELRAMKPTAHLINTSRGPVVDERALVSALARGVIAGAALDVFEAEPAAAEGLLELHNVVVAPHIASATHDTRHAMGMLCVAALRSVLVDDQLPANAVNGDRLRDGPGQSSPVA